jgi:hypothetical protein
MSEKNEKKGKTDGKQRKAKRSVLKPTLLRTAEYWSVDLYWFPVQFPTVLAPDVT